MSAAKETLEKMQKQDVLKGDPQDFHAKLLINKQTRRMLAFFSFLAFICICTLVLYHIRTPTTSWSNISLPIIGIGLLLTLIPLSEEWIYRPWQHSARQYEKHFRFRR